MHHEAPKLIECSQCTALRLAGQKCPHCGFLPKRPPRDVPTAPGELGLYVGGRAQSNGYDPDTRTRWHGMFTAHRRRARLQARMDCPQVQGKVRRVPALGQHTEADPADARGLELGALARDRLRQIEDGDMSKKDKGRLAPFVPIDQEMMRSDAWRAMSFGARWLYMHLKRRWSFKQRNNGRIFLSQRDAQEEMGGGRAATASAAGSANCSTTASSS